MADEPEPGARRPRRKLGAVLGVAAGVGAIILLSLAVLGDGDLLGSAPGLDSQADSAEQTDTGTGKSATSGDRASEGQGGLGDQGKGDGESVPSQEFEMFDGSTATLADWEGQPLVLNFWASWCPPCVGEMGDAFEPAHQEYGDDVAFLGVNVQDNRDLAMDVVEKTGVTYELAEDPEGKLFTEFGGFGMPVTVFISADGEILDTHGGPLTRDQLDAKINELLLRGA